MKRLLCSLLLVASSLLIATSMKVHAQAPLALDPGLGITTIPLYDTPPPSAANDPADQPTLTVFVPQPGRGNGSAIIVAPGEPILDLPVTWKVDRLLTGSRYVDLLHLS